MRDNRPTRLSNNALASMYYAWLCDLVGVSRSRKKYSVLLKTLHEKYFRWLVPNDDNRASDGRDLRERFCDEHNLMYVMEAFDPEISMLEILIGLAFRCENMMDGQTSIPHRLDYWFWKMIENAGLHECSDDFFYDDLEEVMDEILTNIIERRYLRDGKGGLFPLNHPKKDQRKVELWYQMCEYLGENYFREDVIV